MAFEGGAGNQESQRREKRLRSFWNEKGLKLVRVHLRDGSAFVIHYFHADTGTRRRVAIEIDVDIDNDLASIRLIYGKIEVVKRTYRLADIRGDVVDLMKVNVTVP